MAVGGVVNDATGTGTDLTKLRVAWPIEDTQQPQISWMNARAHCEPQRTEGYWRQTSFWEFCRLVSACHHTPSGKQMHVWLQISFQVRNPINSINWSVADLSLRSGCPRTIFRGFLKRGYPQSSSIYMGFSIVNHPFLGYPHGHGNPHFNELLFQNEQETLGRRSKDPWVPGPISSCSLETLYCGRRTPEPCRTTIIWILSWTTTAPVFLQKIGMRSLLTSKNYIRNSEIIRNPISATGVLFHRIQQAWPIRWAQLLWRHPWDLSPWLPGPAPTPGSSYPEENTPGMVVAPQIQQHEKRSETSNQPIFSLYVKIQCSRINMQKPRI